MEGVTPDMSQASHDDEFHDGASVSQDNNSHEGSVTFGNGDAFFNDSRVEFETYKFDKFKVNIDTLMTFIFDPSLQWPLAAGRLFAFALYGPLNENGMLCTGPGGKHVVATWELDIMCMQIEKEDILQIYLHRGSDMSLLSSKEQEAIIAQADAHLKRAKGKAMLPRMTPPDVMGLLEDIPRFPDGTISFHEAQVEIMKYRAERIKQYKLVYPSLTKKKKDTSAFGTVTAGGATGTGSLNVTSGSNVFSGSLNGSQEGMSISTARKRKPKMGKVSEAVCPKTMFMAMKGANNSDIIETTNKYLHNHAYKISTLDTANSPSMTANVRLLREIVPLCSNPYLDKKTGKDTRESWNDTSQMTKTGVGSLVKCAASTTTWKRNTTAY
jgi:hypothetical protein